MSPTRMTTGLRGVGVGDICYFFFLKTFPSVVDH